MQTVRARGIATRLISLWLCTLVACGGAKSLSRARVGRDGNECRRAGCRRRSQGRGRGRDLEALHDPRELVARDGRRPRTTDAPLDADPRHDRRVSRARRDRLPLREPAPSPARGHVPAPPPRGSVAVLLRVRRDRVRGARPQGADLDDRHRRRARPRPPRIDGPARRLVAAAKGSAHGAARDRTDRVRPDGRAARRSRDHGVGGCRRVQRARVPARREQAASDRRRIRRRSRQDRRCARVQVRSAERRAGLDRRRLALRRHHRRGVTAGRRTRRRRSPVVPLRGHAGQDARRSHHLEGVAAPRRRGRSG